MFTPYPRVGGHPCDTPGISILDTLVLPVIKADLTEQQGPPTIQACYLCCSTITIIHMPTNIKTSQLLITSAE